MKRGKSAAAVADNSYFDLVRQFPLKPIASEKELGAATKIINELVDRGFDDLTDGEEAYLDVLSDLVKKYEDERHPIPEASPVAVLQFLIEDRNTNQRAVALGSGIAVSTMSEILAGRREMNLEHMLKLAEFFTVPVAAFLPKRQAPTGRQSSGARPKNRRQTRRAG